MKNQIGFSENESLGASCIKIIDQPESVLNIERSLVRSRKKEIAIKNSPDEAKIMQEAISLCKKPWLRKHLEKKHM